MSSTTNTTEVKNWYFQIEVPDNWIYEEYSDSPAADMLGFGPKNSISLVPNEFNINEIKNGNISEVAAAFFQKDFRYNIKNAPLDMYLQYKLDDQPAMNMTSQEKIVVDGEEAIKIYSEGIEPTVSEIKYLEYLFIHNNEPYLIMYAGNLNNYEKYLSEFEKMVKTFRFEE